MRKCSLSSGLVGNQTCDIPPGYLYGTVAARSMAEHIIYSILYSACMYVCVIRTSFNYTGIHAGGQDVRLNIVDPVDQERLCPDQTVEFECHILEQTAILAWNLPLGGSFLFSFSAMAGDNRTNEQFTAILTNNTAGSMPDMFSILTSTLTVQPPLVDFNDSVVKCGGSIPSVGLVNNMIEITLSGKGLHMNYIHV